jgi:hypothetical protein
MSPVRDVCLSSSDVDVMISEFERKYGVSSVEFFRNPEIRQDLPEDDVFRWEALIDHRLALRDSYQKVHSGYLANLSRSSEEARSDVETQELLAA